MEYVKLGNSNLVVSRLGFGGCPMGGHGWGRVSEEGLIGAVRVALDEGVTFFDTADTYGLGTSESVLGEALRHRRDQAVIATKFGVRVEHGRTFYDNSPAWINAAIRASLSRLGTDHVDLYQIHYRDGVTPLDDVIAALTDLKDRGLIRHYGLSNVTREDAREFVDARQDAVSFQNEFSLANRELEADITTLSATHGWTPLTWGSLGQGILTGKYDASSRFGPQDRRSRATYLNFHGDRLQHNLRIVDVLRDIATEVGRPVPAVAIRWILDRLPNSVALVGIKSTSQLASNLASMDWMLPSASLDALNSVSSLEDLRGQY